VLQWPELAHDDRFRTNALRVANRNALHIVVESTLGPLTTADIVARLEAAQIAYARMNSVAEYLRHPQMIERDVWHDIDSPSGTLRAAKPPVRIAGVEPVMRAVPALGEHTDAILEELGVTRETVAAWRAAGVI
jgi:itaconate CoA-transferase